MKKVFTRREKEEKQDVITRDIEMHDDNDSDSSSSSDDSEDEDMDMTTSSSTFTHDEEITSSEDEDDGDINLSDLISSIDPNKKNEKLTKKSTTISGKQMASLTQNLSQLQRIAREKKKGDVFYAVEQVDLDLQERRAAADMTDERMVKYSSVVDYVQNARTIPLSYKEGHIDKKSRNITTKPAIQTEFTNQFEQILAKKRKDGESTVVPLYDVDENFQPGAEQMSKRLERLSKEELLQKHREVIEKRKALQIQKQKEIRLKKIKSKTFRKIRNREKRKQEASEGLTEEELMKLNPEEARQRILDNEKKYIRERLTLRHKNSSSWVKKSMKHAQHNESVREAISDQLKRGQELLKKQVQLPASHESDEEDELVEQLLDGDAKEVLKQLRGEIENEPAQKGVLGMKFMKRAREKRKQEQMELLQEIQKDVELAKAQLTKTEDSDEEENAMEDSREPEASGRRKFSGARKQSSDDDEESEEEKVEQQVEFLTSVQVAPSKTVTSSAPKILKGNNATQQVVRTVVSEKAATINQAPIPTDAKFNSATSATSAPKEQRKIVVTSVSGKKRKRQSGVANAANPWLNLEKEYKEGRENKKQKTEREGKELEIKISTDQEELGLKVANKKKNDSKSVEETNFEKNVKKQAFAGDDLQLEFEDEKRKVLEEEVDIPTLDGKFLPGWGSWAGNGLDWKKRLEENKRQAALARKKLLEMKEKERADSKLGNVIIRATAKLPEKYINSTLPPTQQNPAKIHDNTMSHPLGSEWNALTSYTNIIQPRAKPKRGTIIAPLDYDTAKAQMKWSKVKQQKELTSGKSADLAARMDEEIQHLEENEKNNWAQIKEEREKQRARADADKQRTIKTNYEERLKHL